ncbi:MAG: glycosyltransferase family 4 protein [Candidatus Magasanikbacteria bacterium]
MKICLINNLYEPYAKGGAEQVVKAIVDFLLKNNHQVVLITLTPKDNDEEIISNSNLTIYRIKAKNIFSFFDLHKHSFLSKFVWHFFDIFNFGIARKIKNILQQEKPDLVHTHNLMGLGFLVPSVIRKLKIKYIHTLHDVQLVEPSGIILKLQEKSFRYNNIFVYLYVFLTKRMFLSPDIVIAPSNFLLNFYDKKGFFSSSKKIVLANPLTFDNVNNIVKKSNQDFNFLYLGQIEKHKGIFELIDAFKKIKNTKLHVVGDGSCLKELKNKFQNLDNVIFYGRKSREELPEIFSKMDVTVFPSICYENYPSVIFESFYFAVPVLASNHSSLPEFIKVGENGWLFYIEKKNDLVEKMQWCLENKINIKKMSLNFDINILKKNSDNYFVELLNLYK